LLTNTFVVSGLVATDPAKACDVKAELPKLVRWRGAAVHDMIPNARARFENPLRTTAPELGIFVLRDGPKTGRAPPILELAKLFGKELSARQNVEFARSKCIRTAKLARDYDASVWRDLDPNETRGCVAGQD
jgi:hypothetical protein